MKVNVLFAGKVPATLLCISPTRSPTTHSDYRLADGPTAVVMGGPMAA